MDRKSQKSSLEIIGGIILFLTVPASPYYSQVSNITLFYLILIPCMGAIIMVIGFLLPKDKSTKLDEK